MHENKFEKQVQEKMDELQFAPSDAVWANVDKEINKDKKRRRPVFWLFFFFGLLLLSGGYFFVMNENNKRQVSKVQEGKVQEGKVQVGKEQEGKVQEGKVQEGKVQEGKVQEGKVQVGKEQEYMEQEDKKQVSKAHEDKVQESTEADYPDQYSKKTKNILNDKRDDKRNKSSSAVKPVDEKSSDAGTVNYNKQKSKSSEQNSIAEKNNDEAADNNTEIIKKAEQRASKKNIADSLLNKKTEVVADNLNITPKKDSANDKKIASNKSQQKKSSAWKIGFAAGAGISNINQSLFKSTYVNNPSAYNANTASGPLPASGYTSSQINPGLSFNAGVFVNKHLSKRISFSAGINYHYYSTKIHTGQSVDSSIYVYSSGTNSTGSLTSQAGSYYRNGSSNSYINQYHFIELPLSINFQLNRSVNTPIIWEAGLSLSYLINSNALHFDPYTDVYYKNNALLNKSQLNAATAIVFGFHIHKNELQLGPQLQYGLTGLLNKNTGNPEHLLYGGIKISIIPQKK